MSKKLNAKELAKKKILDIPEKYRYLDNLSRLFESNSKECSAVCLIDETLIISDNSFHYGSTDENAKIKLIYQTMQYFSSLSKQATDTEKYTNMFKNLALARLKGEELGYIKLDQEDLTYIINKVLIRAEGLKGKKVVIDNIVRNKRFDVIEKRYVASAVCITEDLLKDFNKIFKLLTVKDERENSEYQELIAALEGKKKEFELFNRASSSIGAQHKKQVRANVEKPQPGYLILKYDFAQVHAETKIIAYLLLTGRLEKLALAITDKDLYIGISKLCCASCDKFIQNVNKFVKVNIQTRDTHGLTPVWRQPEILIISNTGINSAILSSLRQNCPEVKKVSKKEGDVVVHQTIYSPSSSEENNTLSPISPFSSLLTNPKKDFESISLLAQQGKLNEKDIDDLKRIIEVAEQKLKIAEQKLENPPLEQIFDKKSNPSVKRSLLSMFNNIASTGKSEPLLKRQKLDNHVDKSWWDDDKVMAALEKYKNNNVNLVYAAQNEDMLQDSLNSVKENKNNTKFVIPIHQNVLDGSINIKTNNHWTALHVRRIDDYYEVDFIDPNGNKIGNRVSDIIKKELNADNINHLLNESNALQKNDYDCGPMLVYAVSAFANSNLPNVKLDKKQSNEFGQFLRESFDNNVPMNDMHAHLTKLNNNIQNLPAKKGLGGLVATANLPHKKLDVEPEPETVPGVPTSPTDSISRKKNDSPANHSPANNITR